MDARSSAASDRLALRGHRVAAYTVLMAIAWIIAGHAAAPEEASIHITSPRGRTGVVTKMRIVAQVEIPEGQTLSKVDFFVDGSRVGTAEAAPFTSVEWLDENPLEQREIVVQATDAAGHLIRDSVVLPPFEVVHETEVTSVLLETGVYDKNGRVVSKLDKDQFTVTENDVQQKIDQVATELLPMHVVLLVDNSQSMSRRMDFVRHAVERLCATLRARDTVVVAPFNAHVGTITGPTNDAATIAHAIQVMHAEGGTAILDSLVEGARLLEGQQDRRALVLITDGYDENSTMDADAVLTRAADARAVIYSVGIGGVAGISLKGEKLLRRIAEQTGGRMFFPPREIDLVGVADAIAADAHSRYLITYTPLDQTKDGLWRDVAVTVPDDYIVRTRSGYFAPSPPPIRPLIEFTAINGAHDYVDVLPEQVEILEDGVQQSVDTFQEAVEPVSIVMAIDASGSMKKSADVVRQTARDFVLAVRPEDSLALISFSDAPSFNHVLALNRQWTLDAIDKYMPNGGTALYDALWNSLLHLKDVPGRRAVVVLTDGRDENNPGTAPGSIHTLEEVLELERTTGAIFFPIGLGTKVERDVLARLAAESGGEAYFASDATLLDEQFRKIVEGLRRRYVLSYTSTNSTRDGRWREVKIVPRGEIFTVSSQGGYFAPGPGGNVAK